MTGRDRIVVIGVAVLVLLGAGWLLVVSPERQQASKLGAQVAAAQTSLSEAEGKLASARTAQAQYASAYTSVVSLGKAVPPSQEVPSLIYQLAQASNEKSVQFASIVNGATTGSSSSSSTATPSAAAGGFAQLPFTFVFNGSFFDLEHLFQKLTGFTTSTSTGDLQVSGRLLTIQSVKLSPAASAEAGNGPKSLTGTITASAYVLPASQGLTGAATAASPTGTGASPASTTAAASSPTPPAIVKVNP
jgi:Tfp pilus assembly protein PilO